MKPDLTIGHFPIIDHLILGVALHNSKEIPVEAKIYGDWQTITSDLTKGTIQGAFLLFPLAFDFVHQGVDLKLVLLGHREGQVLMVRPEITSLEHLKGKTILVPHTFSTHHILLHMALKDAGLSMDDITLRIGFQNPREIVDMLENKEIDAVLSAEPMITDAQTKGFGTILKLSHDINPHHVDCVLVVRQDAIDAHEETVQALVDSLVQAGFFINAYPKQAAEIGEQFLDWPKKTLLRSLTHDRAHILFWDLLPRPEEFADFQDVAVQEMHLWDKGISLEKVIEPKFAQKAYRDWVIDTRKEVKDRGEVRTLPAGFKESVDRFTSFFKEEVQVLGIRAVMPGEKYPKTAHRVKDITLPRRVFLEEIFDGSIYVLETAYAKKKGIAFFGPDTGLMPQRVVIRLSKEEALKVLQVLSWGERIMEVAQYTREEMDKNLFSSPEGISALQDETYTYIAMHFTAFRFLTLMLAHL